jgi:hypothetical protein
MPSADGQQARSECHDDRQPQTAAPCFGARRVRRRWHIGDRVQGAEGQGAGQRDQRQ